MSRTIPVACAFLALFGLSLSFAANPQAKAPKTREKFKFFVNISNSAEVPVTVKVNTKDNYKEYTVPKKSSKKIKVPLVIDRSVLESGLCHFDLQIFVGGDQEFSATFSYEGGQSPADPNDDSFDLTQYSLDFAALPEGGSVWHLNPL